MKGKERKNKLVLQHVTAEGRRVHYRATPTTAEYTLRRDMLSSRVVKSEKSSYSTGVGDAAAASRARQG